VSKFIFVSNLLQGLFNIFAATYVTCDAHRIFIRVPYASLMVSTCHSLNAYSAWQSRKSYDVFYGGSEEIKKKRRGKSLLANSPMDRCWETKATLHWEKSI